MAHLGVVMRGEGGREKGEGGWGLDEGGRFMR
jgi:hypothetical protein